MEVRSGHTRIRIIYRTWQGRALRQQPYCTVAAEYLPFPDLYSVALVVVLAAAAVVVVALATVVVRTPAVEAVDSVGEVPVFLNPFRWYLQ